MSKLKDMHAPIFWAEGWQIKLDRLVEQPVTLTYEEIIALPRCIADARLTEDHSIHGYWEARGYTDEAQIMAGRVHAVNTHRWRRIPGGEVSEFLDWLLPTLSLRGTK